MNILNLKKVHTWSRPADLLLALNPVWFLTLNSVRHSCRTSKLVWTTWTTCSKWNQRTRPPWSCCRRCRRRSDDTSGTLETVVRICPCTAYRKEDESLMFLWVSWAVMRFNRFKSKTGPVFPKSSLTPNMCLIWSLSMEQTWAWSGAASGKRSSSWWRPMVYKEEEEPPFSALGMFVFHLYVTVSFKSLSIYGYL